MQALSLGINLDVPGFIGAVGLSETGGVTDVDPGEVLIKQAMSQRCVNSIVIADSCKWGRLAPYTVIEPQRITRIITTEKAPGVLVEYFRNMFSSSTRTKAPKTGQ